jgi:hypothetical protein
MLTQTEITDAYPRLQSNKLDLKDQKTLIAIIRLYLKKLSADFLDLETRIADANDTDGAKTASKLAAILAQIEDSGFAVSELKGGRSGLVYRELDEQSLRIRFAVTLLNYDLPETFSGRLDASSEENVNNNVNLPIFGSSSVSSSGGW